MSEVFLTKTPSGHLMPVDASSAEELERFKPGQAIRCEVKRARSYPYHKRWFALAKYAFDIWSETMPRMEYRGQQVQPNFDRFRKDLTILAGFYEPVFNVRGEMRVEPKSLSFGSMDQAEFESVYSASIDAVLTKVLNNPKLTEKSVREAVDRVLMFS